MTTLADHFIEHAEREPSAPALIWQGEHLSYGRLHEMAMSAAAELARLELPTDRPVGIRAKKSPEAIALVLACLKQQRPFVLPSVELPVEILDQLFAQAGASRVLAPGSSAGNGGGLDAGEPQSSEPSQWPPPSTDVSFMLTTSGSTGLPKIVPLAPSAIDAFTDWAAGQFDIRPGTTVINYAPLNFDLCLLDIWTTLKYGGCVALVDQDQATSGGYLADLITDYDVNVCQAVPMLYRLLIDVARDDGRTFPSVRHVITTGDKMPATTLKELPALFPNARFFNIYGCTETNDSMMAELDVADGDVPTNIPIGQPLPGVDARVETDGVAIEGEGTGELLVWTPFQTQGYLRADLNEGKFVDKPDGEGEKPYYRTGDIVNRHGDGTLTIVGRSDFYVKVRGVRVSTQVVEQAIQEHPDVIEVGVVAVEDELAGARLHARVRKEPDSKLNSLSLRQHCSTRLARTEMPSSIDIVTEPLPKTSTGKIDRKQIGPIKKERARANG
jgi:acyl-coenzyme A synthetase/AMP-(fatty) acid ligase